MPARLKGACGAIEHMTLDHVHQMNAALTNFASATAGLVFESKPMLFNFKKLFIDWQNLGRALFSRGPELFLGVR